MALSQTSVIKLYNTVVEDVIGGVRDCFLDDGVDEQVLQELRSLWKSKLTASGAMDPPQPERSEHAPPPILQNFQKTNGAGTKRAVAAAHHAPATALHEPQQSSSRQPLQEAAPHGHAPPSHMSVPVSAPALNNERVPVQLTLPAQPGVPGSQPRVFTIQIPASALNGQQLHQVLTGPIISATLNLPQPLAATLLQQHINAALAGHESGGGGGGVKGAAPLGGLDGAEDSSEEEASVGGGEGSGAGSDAGAEEEEEEEDEEVEEEEEEEEREPAGAEEEPLNSGDDVSDEEPGDMFDTENVVVCQYDKITRSRNRWKFYLKDGIMNLTGKDFVFQKANGDAEW